MSYLFAAKDIESPNLKVKSGRPLPERFQASRYVKYLREAFGADAIVEIGESTSGYMIVKAAEFEALQKELEEYRDNDGRRHPAPEAGGHDLAQDKKSRTQKESQ